MSITILGIIALILIVADVIAFLRYRKLLRLVTKRASDQAVEVINGDWSVLATGRSGNPELERAWLTAAQRMFTLFARKNHDYGPYNLAIGGVIGVVVRLGDKISRMWQLVGLSGKKEGALVNDEGMEDTFLDTANYALVGYMMQIEAWPKATIGDSLGRQALMGVILETLGEMTEEERMQVYTYLVANELTESEGSQVTILL